MDKLNKPVAEDKIRKTWPSHSAILGAIAGMLVRRFTADLCLIGLVDLRTGTSKMQVIHDHTHLQMKLGETGVQELTHSALEGNKLESFRVSTLDFHIPDNPGDLSVLLLPVSLGTNEPRGAILLARTNAAFTRADKAFFGRANLVA